MIHFTPHLLQCSSDISSLNLPLTPRRQLPFSERFYPEAVHCLGLIPQVFISVLQIKFCSFFEIRFPKIS